MRHQVTWALALILGLPACAGQQATTMGRVEATHPSSESSVHRSSNREDQPSDSIRGNCPTTDRVPPPGEQPPATIARLIRAASRRLWCDPLDQLGAYYLLDAAQLAERHHICNPDVQRAHQAFMNMHGARGTWRIPITLAELDRGLTAVMNACDLRE